MRAGICPSLTLEPLQQDILPFPAEVLNDTLTPPHCTVCLPSDKFAYVLVPVNFAATVYVTPPLSCTGLEKYTGKVFFLED